MYTLRDDAAKDFVRTLREVAKIGYQAVELAGYGGLDAQELKAHLDDMGLQVAGSHVALGALEGNLQEVVDYSLALGNRYVVCPSLPGELRNESGYHRVADALNTAGTYLKGAGLQLAYHNHAFEFTRLPSGEYAYDVLMEMTDPELVKIELDTYWVKKGGEDPAAYMRRYAGRVPLVHLKDMTPGENPTFAEVGEGVMDFDAIFMAAEVAGAEYYIVEQDRCERPPLESVKISYQNLQGMGIAP
jgi:sugar phosphate isomerase/epimerase